MRHLARTGCSYRVIREMVISHAEGHSYDVHQALRPRATRAFAAAPGGRVGVRRGQRGVGGSRWIAAALALAVAMVAGILAAPPPAQASSPSVTLTSLTADAV